MRWQPVHGFASLMMAWPLLDASLMNFPFKFSAATEASRPFGPADALKAWPAPPSWTDDRSTPIIH
jgi:hypothetical protein